mmetsp:Transcript_6943/g.20818  ORF Transcript_6943/g.20818 Transcript_6943/m.20818 type:complete len:354 (+) Transcript_6943:1727-2788(+)
MVAFLSRINIFLLWLLFVRGKKVTPSSMPGLEEPLKNASFWIPPECYSDFQYETDRIDIKVKNVKKGKMRPAGWNVGSMHYGKLVLDRAVSALYEHPGNRYFPFESKAVCAGEEDLREKKLTKIELKKQKVWSELIAINSTTSCDHLPAIVARSWGTCAFVASGSNLLYHKRGKQIDSLDTVIRIGHMPLTGWSEYVGARTDVLIGRGSIQSRHAQSYSDLKFIIGKDVENFSVKHLRVIDSLNYYPETTSLNGIKVRLGTPRFALILYRLMTTPINKKARGPTSGYLHVLRIIFSGLCSKIHIFGLSSECGGHYYNQKEAMKFHHSCELESWSLHYLMKNYQQKTHVCIWNS